MLRVLHGKPQSVSHQLIYVPMRSAADGMRRVLGVERGSTALLAPPI